MTCCRRSRSLLGVAVVVLEGLQHPSQYHQNWLNYRATREALKREKFLFPADAGRMAPSRTSARCSPSGSRS